MTMPAKAWDQVFEWWLRVLEEYIDLIKRNPFFLQWMGISLQQHLEAKRWTDLIMDRMWRQLGLPPLQEINRVHEKLSLLESKLSSLREEDLPRMMQALPEGLAKAAVRRYA
jgi:hypothetical protein